MRGGFKAYIALLAIMLCGCNRSNVTLSGRIIGSNSDRVLVERVVNNLTEVVDSVRLDDRGYFKLSIKGVEESPMLYNIAVGQERIPLFLASGESLSINSIGSVLLSYRVEGSEESERLRIFYQSYLKGLYKLENIATKHASGLLSEEQRRELSRDYGAEYQSIKQSQLRFIIENQASLAAVYALFQRLPGDEYLFNEQSDVIYFRTVADALEQSYPNSSYLKSLRSAIEKMESRLELKNGQEEVSFPEITMPDMYGEIRSLSSLMGHVILLNFWSPEAGNSNVQNAELKEIYTKYRNMGFEIFQVGVSSSKSAWISVVQDQRLSWISVSDMRGATSPSLGEYNVSLLPTTFLINKAGDIVARDVVIDESLESRIEKLLKE